MPNESKHSISINNEEPKKSFEVENKELNTVDDPSDYPQITNNTPNPPLGLTDQTYSATFQGNTTNYSPAILFTDPDINVASLVLWVTSATDPNPPFNGACDQLSSAQQRIDECNTSLQPTGLTCGWNRDRNLFTLTLSATPTQPATYPIIIHACNISGTAVQSQQANITIQSNPANFPQITSNVPPPVSLLANQPYQATFEGNVTDSSSTILFTDPTSNENSLILWGTLSTDPNPPYNGNCSPGNSTITDRMDECTTSLSPLGLTCSGGREYGTDHFTLQISGNITTPGNYQINIHACNIDGTATAYQQAEVQVEAETPSPSETATSTTSPSITASISESSEPSNSITPSETPQSSRSRSLSPSLSYSASSSYLPPPPPTNTPTPSNSPSALPSSPSTSPSSPSNNGSLALLLGLPIASLFVLLLVFAAYCYKRYQTQVDREDADEGDEEKLAIPLLSVTDSQHNQYTAGHQQVTAPAQELPYEDYLDEPDPQKLYNLGLLYKDGKEGKSQDYEKAKICFERALENKSDLAEARFELGVLYEQGHVERTLRLDKRLEKAIQHYTEAMQRHHLQASQRLPEAQFKLAQYLESAYPDKAISLYEAAIMANVAEAYCALGQLLEKQAHPDYTRIQQLYETYGQLRPLTAKPHLSRIYGKQAKLAETQEQLTQARTYLDLAKQYDMHEDTLLHLAVRYDCGNLLAEFLQDMEEKGTYDVFTKNKSGQTALQLAVDLQSHLAGDLLDAEKCQRRIDADGQQFQNLLDTLKSQRPASRKTFLVKEDQELKKLIMDITVEDVTSAALDAIQQALKKIGALDFPEERRLLQGVLAKIQQPASLVKYIQKKGLRNQLQSFLNFNDSAYSLEPLLNLNQELRKTIQRLSPLSPFATITEALQKISTLYEEFAQLFTKSTPAQQQTLLSPKASIYGADLHFRHLTAEATEKLVVAEDDTTNRENIHGAHIVRIFNGVHYKINPTAPGVEFMVKVMASIIAGHGAPASELLKVTHSNHDLPYLASKTVQGINFDYILLRQPHLIDKIDIRNFSGLMILDLLTDPYDAKPDNLMTKIFLNAYNPDEIESIQVVNIDNDLSFADEIVVKHSGERENEHYVSVKNILYLLPKLMDSPIDESFCKTFLKSPPDIILIQWLQALADKNRYYDNLLAQGILSSGEFGALNLPIKLVPGMIIQLRNKLVAIQTALRANPQITHRQLFKKIQPILHDYYQKIQEKIPDPRKAILYIYQQAAPSIQDMITLQRAINSRHTLMSQLAYHKARSCDFDTQRTQTVKEAMEKLVTAIQLPPADLPGQKSIAGYMEKLYLIEHFRLTNDSLLQRVSLEELVKKLPALKQITLKHCHTLKAEDIIHALAENRSVELTLGQCNGINRAKHWQLLVENCPRFTLLIENVAFAIGSKTPAALIEQAQTSNLYAEGSELVIFLNWYEDYYHDFHHQTTQFLQSHQRQLSSSSSNLSSSWRNTSISEVSGYPTAKTDPLRRKM